MVTKSRARSKPRVFPRVLILLLAGASLLAGLNFAAVRLGAWAPVDSTELALRHGIIMVFGFLGTAIGLERAVSAQKLWGYAAPMLSGAGALLAAFGAPRLVCGTSMSLGMLTLCGLYGLFLHRQWAGATTIELAGAVSALGAIVLWTSGWEVPAIVGFVLMFPVLTIIGERLELARIEFTRPGREHLVLGLVALIVATLPFTLFTPAVAFTVLGFLLAALTLAMFTFDVARKTLRATGQAQFMAAAMLTGYGWLLTGALIWTLGGNVQAGFLYETLIHSITLGFTLSMIFAHAPIIIPAIAHRSIPLHPVLWVALALLHLGLIIRFVFGAARQIAFLWQWGGALNIMTTLLFVLSVLSLAGVRPWWIRHKKRAAQPQRIPAPTASGNDSSSKDTNDNAAH